MHHQSRWRGRQAPPGALASRRRASSSASCAGSASALRAPQLQHGVSRSWRRIWWRQQRPSRGHSEATRSNRSRMVGLQQQTVLRCKFPYERLLLQVRPAAAARKHTAYAAAMPVPAGPRQDKRPASQLASQPAGPTGSQPGHPRTQQRWVRVSPRRHKEAAAKRSQELLARAPGETA